jgi:hypothetical protein
LKTGEFLNLPNMAPINNPFWKGGEAAPATFKTGEGRTRRFSDFQKLSANSKPNGTSWLRISYVIPEHLLAQGLLNCAN